MSRLLTAIRRFSAGTGAVPVVCCSMAMSGADSPALADGVQIVRDEAGKLWFEHHGDRFMSLAVNTVTPRAWNPRAGTEYYDAIPNQFGGDRSAWEASTLSILDDAGFNTLGCWSDPALSDERFWQTPVLYVADHAADRFLAGLEPDFEERVRERTRAVLNQHPDTSRILGVFLDNEIAWWGRTGWDMIPTYTMLEAAFEREAGDPARLAAMRFIQDRFASPRALGETTGVELRSWDELDVAYLQRCRSPETTDLRRAFGAMVADAYFKRATPIVREEIPHALILGVRFAGDAPDEAIRTCGRYCDAVSINHYRPDERSTQEILDRYWLLTERPLMITEFSWRAHENLSGNPNNRGAGAVVATQADRAESYRRFIEHISAFPMVVGWSWFEWADQSPQGRFDYENSNYGLVSIRHERYERLLSEMASVNSQAPSIHAKSNRPYPTGPVERRGVRYRPGQHPDRPATVSLMADPAAPTEVWHSADGTIALAPAEGGLQVTYDTGTTYGIGLSMFGPSGSRIEAGSEFACDLDGYDWIVLDAVIPEGLQVQVIVNESGSNDPNSPTFDTSAGDDAESFISAPRRGRGGESQYRFRIADMVKQVYWGNQTGRREIEMRAVQSIAIQFQGQPREGVVLIRDVRLER